MRVIGQRIKDVRAAMQHLVTVFHLIIQQRKFTCRKIVQCVGAEVDRDTEVIGQLLLQPPESQEFLFHPDRSEAYSHR